MGSRSTPRVKKRPSDEHDSAAVNDGNSPSTVKRPRVDDKENNYCSPLAQRARNPQGKPPEAGVLKQIYVENFMCHTKLTVDLCRNVNFIHGQNGSGKSAILAAIQICLGAGARRTNRARNLKDLVRKDATCSCAKIRVTLLNRGEDAYHHDIYGDSITVERTIALRGGFNGYKLLDHQMNERSRSKKDLDEMLDKLNIQVENPVAILDQEEAKKFLTGKSDDKYDFFMKATELERIDRTYANTKDMLEDMTNQAERMNKALEADKHTVEDTKRAWEKHQEMGKLEKKLGALTEAYAWSFYKTCQDELENQVDSMQAFREKAEKKQDELTQAEEASQGAGGEETAMKAKLDELVAEAQEQSSKKHDLEVELKRAREPQKALERQLNRLQEEKEKSRRNLEQAQARLQQRREQIMAQSGSAESEDRRRTEQLKAAEEELAAAQQKVDELKQAISNAYRAYEELEPYVEQARQNSSAAERVLNAVENKIRGLESSTSDSLAMYGQRCTKVKQMVENAQKQGRFTGPVVGPVGAYIKIAPGKENFASIAELALGQGVFDRFIVTNDQDRKTFQAIRREAGCRQDCGVFQLKENSRYQVPNPPVPGIETVASTLNISHDLVFNCLVDNCRIDEVALSRSREESERLLLVENGNGKLSVRGRMKSVFCLPEGDHWSVMDGTIAIVGNEKPMRQTIGVDKTAALAEAKREAEGLREDLQGLRKEESKLEHQHTNFQKDWNVKKRESQGNNKVIENLMTTIEKLKAEQDSVANFDTDTSEQEGDVAEAQQQVEVLKDQEEAMKEAFEAKKPEIQEIKNRLEEVKIRNEKVLADLKSAEDDLGMYIQNLSQRQEKLEKKREKVKQYQTIIAKQEEKIQEVENDAAKYLRSARKLTYKRIMEESRANEDEGSQVSEPTQEPTDEDLESIETIDAPNEPKHYEARITRAKKKIEQERARQAVSNESPAAAYEKYVRAKQTLAGKMDQIEVIEKTCRQLKSDLKKRARRWEQFRKHISQTTDTKFDKILNLKGSSGELNFDHKEHRLDLIVQKDSADANSQQKDVKALSGGERSFTTIALLLALGESLETPFRILDEFDVFLDPVTRKLTIEALIEMAKEMEHRQFIFITPQDVSNVKPDHRLKILKMTPPARNQVAGAPMQQTLGFSQN